MLNTERLIKKLHDVLPFLKEAFNVKRIAIFGSTARGTASKDSDIDLFIEFVKPIGLTFMDLAEYLEKLFNKKVDILTPEGISSIKISEVIQSIKKSMIYV